MSKLYKHRIFCNTDNRWAYAWTESSTLLVTCPDNATHATQNDSSFIEDEKEDNTIVINKEPNIVTQGNIKIESIAIEAGTPLSKTWPYDIAIYNIRIAVTSEIVGFNITIDSAPRTTIGALTTDAAIGTTVLNVTPATIANVSLGTIVTLQQDAIIQELGPALAVDNIKNNITVEVPTFAAVKVGTLVKITQRITDRMELPLVGYLTFGEDRAKVLAIKKGKPLVFSLINPKGVNARLIIYVSYNY